MTENDPLISELSEGRKRFLALVADVRPELHRYCTRMIGSIADGEDIVQETLARAYYALTEFESVPPLRAWLSRIAHNRALDYMRRYEHRMGQPLSEMQDHVVDANPSPEDALAHSQAIRVAVSRFVELAPTQRSCVILKDVLGHSLEEIAVLLELSVPAVKAALHRGRESLRDRLQMVPETGLPQQFSTAVVRYTALFNARDWEGVRAMLAEDVRLDLISRSQRTGRHDVGHYFTNYAKIEGWHLVPVWLDDREVIAVFRHADDARPGYFIELGWNSGRIVTIRDFRYVPYVMQEAEIRGMSF